MNYIPPDLNNPVDIHSVNVSEGKPLTELLKLTFGLILVVLWTVFTLNIAIDLAIQLIPQQLEKPWSILFEKATDDMRFSSEGHRKLQPILNQLVSHLENTTLNYQVHVVNDGKTINAVSYPAGHIVVYQELINQTKNDDELAFVLAHELGHYHHRDHLRGISKSVLISVVMSSLLSQHEISPLTQQATQFSMLHFSRDDEYAADDFALKLVQKAGYSADKGIHFFNHLSNQNTIDWLSTHPAPQNRIRRLKSQKD